ncbi:MAG: hypothetical protein CVU55_14540 [Deltaproteobacteria bacterium HGW-Deltaproteobacteria-13]|nr:MAG: hypothetical protein CVU55_14540 [Deltaproteobacteria bacterium HGW-Deltaproteobacteria-13]
MKDQSKTKQLLIQELVSLRQRIAGMEQSESEWKKEKEELKNSEARFRNYFALPLHGIAITSPEKGWIEVNDRICFIMGYSRDEIVRMTWSEMTHPDDLAADMEQFNRILSGKIENYNMDKRFIRKDGTVVWTNLSVGCVRKSDGSVDHIIALVDDITDRKRMESIMQARLHLLEFANSHAMDELLTAALDEIEALTGSTIGFYHFVESDQKTLSLQNWSTNTIKNMCAAEGKGSHYDVDQAGVWVDCVHERRPVIHNDYASLPHRKGMPEGHAPVIREIVVPIFRSNQIKAIIGVGNKSTNYDDSDIEIVSQLGDLSWDIAERKRAEEVLRINEGRYRKAEAMGHVGNWEYNLQTTKFWGSGEAKRIYGFDPETLDLSTDEVENCIPERERVHQALIDLIQAGKPYNLEFDIHPKNSLKPRIISSVAELKRDEHGKPLLVTGVIQDITERKRAEAEITGMNRALRMLSATNQALIHVADEPTLLTEVCRIIVEVGGYLMAWVGFAEQDEAKTVRPVAHAGFGSGYVESAEVTWADNERGRGPGGTAIRTGQPCIARNILLDPAFAPWREAAIERGYKSNIALPLINEGRTLGELAIYSVETEAFDTEEVEVLKEMADDLAFGITVLRTRVKRDQTVVALHESEERYRLIAENTADTIAVFDLNFKTTYVSPSMLKLRGYTVQEAMTQTLNQILTPDSLLQASKMLADQMALEFSGTADPARTTLIELEEYCKDGSTIWVELSASFLRDGNFKPTGILTVTRNITERKQAEEALRNSESRMRTLVQTIPDLIWLKDPAGVYLSCNTIFERLFGTSEAAIVGKTDYDFVDRELADAFRENDRKAISAGKPTSNEEWITFADDGHRVLLETIKTPMYDVQGILIGVLGIGHDITDRKQASERIRRVLGATVQAMAVTVEARDPYTAGHQRRVADLARAIATEMNLPLDIIEGLRMAASIHDLGKISVPAEILSKPTKLTDIEFMLIKTHSQSDYDILKDIDFPWPLAQIVYQHHERMNGSGYPRNLKGDEIIIEARIMAVADTVEAMASHRPYRAGLGIESALEEIAKNKGILYDDAVVDACLRLFREKGYQLS